MPQFIIATDPSDHLVPPDDADSSSSPTNGSGASAIDIKASELDFIDGILGDRAWDGPISYDTVSDPAFFQAGYFSDRNGDKISAQDQGYTALNKVQLGALHFALDTTSGPAADAAFSVEGFTDLDLSFADKADGNATIRVANSADTQTAYAYLPSGSDYGGDSFFGNFYDTEFSGLLSLKTPVPGNYAWLTFLHEMGHSLGLLHGHEAGGFGALPPLFDSIEYSVMTYRGYVGGPTNSYTFELFGASQTFMMFDIAALQYMYGADFTANSGNTVYSWDPLTGATKIDGAVAIQPGANRIFATIWDGDGIDTYDLSNYATPLTVDLRPGAHSVFSLDQLAELDFITHLDARGNIFNALQYNGDARSLIENAIGGSNGDALLGNAAVNLLEGRDGNDLLHNEGAGDTLIGGKDNDRYFVTDAKVTIVENPGEGYDYVHTDLSFALRDYSQNIEELVLTGTADSAGTGNGQPNTITGNDGNNLINGASGNDFLFGGLGNDTFFDDNGGDAMTGGKGNDIYYVDSPGDSIIELAGEGVDTVKASITFELRSFGNVLENLTLLGSAKIDGTGNALANTIIGNSGDNLLNGALGNDILEGGDGNDTFKDDGGADKMSGGKGDDTYFVDDPGDTITEAANQGKDTVNSAISLALRDLSQNLEILNLTGSAKIDGIGNALANTITGNSGNNIINGASGDDILNGGDGNDAFFDDNGSDTMTGGKGDDLYRVDNIGDVIVENFGEGFNSVRSFISFALRDQSQNLEDLALLGTDNIDGTGNGQANRIIGNAGNNILNGAFGDDILNGGSGNDSFLDDSGADVMIGGAGHDTYRVDDAGDTIFENKNEGYDTVNASVSFALRDHSQNLEILNLTGSDNIDGAGNVLNNTITGNGGDNKLNGAFGNDILIGGGGDDTLSDDGGNDSFTGGSGGDVFVFAAGFGKDTITDFELGVAGEMIDLSAIAAITDFADLKASHLSQNGLDAVISDGAGNTITLTGIAMASLSSGDFLF